MKLNNKRVESRESNRSKARVEIGGGEITFSRNVPLEVNSSRSAAV